MSDGCTNASPCRQPILRWVHSEVCQIGTLSATVVALRDEIKEMRKLLWDVANDSEYKRRDIVRDFLMTHYPGRSKNT